MEAPIKLVCALWVLFSITKQRMVKCVLIELNLLSMLLPGPKITMLPKS